MERHYTLNEIALMTGFTTRTLRNYINDGILTGEKEKGIWQFSAENIDRFFSEPYVKEGLRIKRSSLVFDFMAERKKQKRSCMILDIPATQKQGNGISSFFCELISGLTDEASDVIFNYGWDNGLCRIILTGSAEPVANIIRAYYASELSDLSE